MKVLHLTLKKKWFDMIDAGIKTEEYRELKDYWITRLHNRDYDEVQFRHGYKTNAPTMRFKVLGFSAYIGTGNPEWGAKVGIEYFVIKLGERVS
jgi:hypothetical protein